MIRSIFSIIIGYLLGSILMAYVLGKILRKIDIRDYGSKNPGAMNAFKVLGPAYGVITMLFDMSKGVLAIFIAYLLKVPTFILFMVGLFAIAGHTFPFYLNFKGGRGAATAYGILIWLNVIIIKDYLTIQASIPFALFFFFVLACYWVTRSINFTAIWGLPVFVGMIFYHAGFNPYSIFLALICVILLIASIVTIRINGGIKSDLESHGRNVVKIKLVRKIVRLGAIVIPILYLTTSRKVAGWVTGVILLIFIIFEIIRRIKPELHKVRMFKILLKSDEPARLLSGYTFFIISSFIVIMLFSEGIGGLSLIFLTLGDLVAELVGLNFGRFRTFPGKSLEGSLGCFSICLLSGFIVMIFLDVSLLQVLIGSIVATFVESIPKIEDNLFIAPISALAMRIIR